MVPLGCLSSTMPETVARSTPTSPTAIGADNLTAVICAEAYSKDTGNPKPGGKVDFPGPGERIKVKTPDDAMYYAELENIKRFFEFTDIRILLLYPATDYKEASRNMIDFLRYYYAISDITVRATCSCNLHAASCMSTLNGDTVCECQHNTAGKDCERCLPLYNNKPWREGSFLPARVGTANACEKCECNDHALSCTFNSTLNYGKCDNCLHNTTGMMCEECLDTFYPNVALPLNDTNVCPPCDCERDGLLNPADTKCQKNRTQPNIGQCTCKANVTGRRCDQCQPQYYGLLLAESPGTCKPCACNTKGTQNNSNICDSSNGQCPCKTSIEGRPCDKCKAGYFQFPALSSEECRSCACDPGGSTTMSCDDFGMCTCVPHVTGTKCEQAERYFFVPSLDEFILQPEGGTCSIDGDLWTPLKPFDGTTFATCPPSGEKVVEFKYLGVNEQFNVTWPYQVGVRYSLGGVTARVGARLELTATGNTQQITAGSCGITFGPVATLTMNLEPGQSTAVMASPPVTIDRRCAYTLKLTLPDHVNGTDPTLIDSLIFLPSLNDSAQAFRITAESSSAASQYTSTCMGQLAALLSRETAIRDTPCSKVLYTVSAEVYKEGKACQCSPVGTLDTTCENGQCDCAPLGGQCTCKPGVGGRRCDVCMPGYYNLSSSGCTECPLRPCPELAPPTSATLQSKTGPFSDTPDTTGLFIALGLTLCAVFLACIAFLWLHPGFITRHITCLKKHPERRKNIRVINKGPGGNLGSHDPRNHTHKEINDRKVTWISAGNTNMGYSPSPSDTRSDSEYDEIPAFFFAQGTQLSDGQPEARSIVHGDYSNGVSTTEDSETGTCNAETLPSDIIPPPPSFDTFKSDNPITLPVITVSKPSAPSKPKRKKLKSIKPVKLADDNQNNVDDYNTAVDDNCFNENLLQQNTMNYAGYDSYDEVNGSLV
ncbi:laminin subunit beta-1-like isoform X2 [Haliotis rubra]|uniref:laminin subunit beta-1-like isoform X2 n=1 Tax=Haliotis rubra TaxID=36100 RepID=UPI001EE5338A|nr:laminin subunit beta-1-like isoform X2 [Haliotis rubra]